MSVEIKDKRPSCETPMADRPDGVCGSERALKRVIYEQNPYVSSPDTVHCPEHFPKAWANENAKSAEPVTTAKD